MNYFLLIELEHDTFYISKSYSRTPLLKYAPLEKILLF